MQPRHVRTFILEPLENTAQCSSQVPRAAPLSHDRAMTSAARLLTLSGSFNRTTMNCLPDMLRLTDKETESLLNHELQRVRETHLPETDVPLLSPHSASFARTHCTCQLHVLMFCTLENMASPLKHTAARNSQARDSNFTAKTLDLKKTQSQQQRLHTLHTCSGPSRLLHSSRFAVPNLERLGRTCTRPPLSWQPRRRPHLTREQYAVLSVKGAHPRNTYSNQAKLPKQFRNTSSKSAFPDHVGIADLVSANICHT